MEGGSFQWFNILTEILSEKNCLAETYDNDVRKWYSKIALCCIIYI